MRDRKHEVGEKSLERALEYASWDWPIIPVQWVDSNGGCSCGRAACSSAGKHPLTRHGLRDGTTNETIIREWWTTWPSANLGIVTGRISGLLVVDVDPRHGGNRALADLARERGQEVPEATVITGGGGHHLYFACPPEPTRSRQNWPARGLDVRADGGYVVAPPSLHASGHRYRWTCSMHPSRLAPAPDWLLGAS